MAQRVYFCVNASISGHLRRVSASVSCLFIAFGLFVLFRVISWIEPDATAKVVQQSDFRWARVG